MRTLTNIPSNVLQALKEKQLGADSNGTVHWKPNSKSHPRQWPLRRKLYDVSIICLSEFFTTLVSNIGSSVARYARTDVDVSAERAIFCFVTLYLFGQAPGGLVFPPIAESFGGRTIYLIGAGGFAASCLIIGASPKLPTVIVGQFLSGVFSAMPKHCECSGWEHADCTDAKFHENMFDAKGRIWAIQIWVMVAIFALALDTPIATYVSESSIGWNWVYYASAIGNAIIAILCSFIRESRPALVLHKHLREIQETTGYRGLSLGNELRLLSAREFMNQNLVLPLRLWFTEPLVFLVALMAAVSFGFIYLFAEALHVVYHNGFGLGESKSSLIFLAIGVGVLFTWVPRLYDVHLTRSEVRRGVLIEPEAKLLGYYVAAPLLAAGLWWFSATVPPLVKDVSIWASIPSLALVGYGIVEFDSIRTHHTLDLRMPSGIFASSAEWRVSLFAPKKFEALGANNALFLLAGIATAFCGIAVMFRYYAKTIRERSPFAQKTFGGGTRTKSAVESRV